MHGLAKKISAVLFFGLLAFPVFAFCQVDTAWVRYFSGPGTFWEEAHAVAVDDSGNVYLAGYSAGSTAHWAVVKYDRNGNLIWFRQRPGITGDAYYVVLDLAGNAYVTGTNEGPAGSLDYLTIKYDPQGNEAWAAQYDGPAGGSDWGFWMAIDESNNIYVTGSCADSSGGRETAVIKYDPNGNQRWVARYNSPLNLQDQAMFIAVDNNQNVYVAGHSDDYPGEQKEWLTIKYDSLGQEKWVRTFRLWPSTGRNLATKVMVDAFGNVVVTGGSTDSTGKQVYVTIKYDSLGNTIWMTQENEFSSRENLVGMLDLDSLGNIYVTGYGDYDIATLKYDFNGSKLWEHRYTGPITGSSMPLGIKVDKRGDVYVAGASRGIGTRRDFTAIKLDSMGNELWVKRFVGADTSSDDLATFATFDAMGNVYITGRSDRIGQSDMMILKYSPLPTLKGDLSLDGDLNCDGRVSPADVSILLLIFFASIPPPC